MLFFFNTKDEQPKSNHKTQITPEIPTITLDDDDDDEVINENDIAITNVVEHKLPDLLGITGISEITADDNQDPCCASNDIFEKQEDSKNIKINNNKESFINTSKNGEEKNSTNSKCIKDENTSIFTEKSRKNIDESTIDSDSEYRRTYNKKCHELIMQRCWRKRRRKKKRMKSIEERQSGIIVISSDENDSNDNVNSTTSSDDTDFKQPSNKMAKFPSNNLSAAHNKDCKNFSPKETIENMQEDLNEDSNESESLTSTDMSSEFSLPNNVDSKKKNSLISSKHDNDQAEQSSQTTENLINGAENNLNNDIMT